MSFESRVLVNGVWTSRRMDVQTILENHRRPVQRASTDHPIKAGPNLAVMTKTVIGSPVVNWILPARIRSKEKNDVIFIGVSILPSSIKRILWLYCAKAIELRRALT